MAAALADLTNVQKRVIQILNANQSAFATTVSGNVGAFPYDAEITLAILEADEEVAVSGYFQSVNDTLAQPFIVTSTPLADRDNVPWHHGTIKAVEVSKTTLNLTSASINTTSDVITSVAHGLTTGDIVTFLIVSGGLPSPLAAATNYFAIVLTADTFQLATTYGNAVYAGTAIDLTTTGSGRWVLIDWITGVEAANLDDITNAAAVGDAYVGAGAFNFLFKEDTGTIYTTANYCRANYPEYVRTSALQSRQAEEYLVICGAVKMLTKNASPAPFNFYTNESVRGLNQLVQDGLYTKHEDSQQGSNG
jgi:hypothetical protein